MAKFRKKPVVIEAIQWHKGAPYVDGMETHSFYSDPADFGGRQLVSYPVVNTLEGKMRVSSGDWIITGVNGEKYPCKPDIFEKTYEPAD